MTDTGYIRDIADTAWDSMRAHDIVPTPRHYEIWYAYVTAENPALSNRLDGLVRDNTAITRGLLDGLYREFFATGIDISAIRDSAGELQQITAEMADRVTADRTVVESLGNALSAWNMATRTPPTGSDLARASATLNSATALTGERLNALEQLFAASMLRIDELKQKLAAAEHDASRDALTGLANRRSFDASLRTAAQRSDEQNTPLALLMVDLDHFKRFNDDYGHPVGDKILRLVSRVLIEQIKGRDTAARYGGEEFAVILPGTDLAGGITVGEQLRRTLERRPIFNRGTTQHLGVLTCSVGVAEYKPGMQVGDLIDRADRALYRAKHTGRNKVVAGDAAGPYAG
jgi:diguanylate cyclase